MRLDGFPCAAPRAEDAAGPLLYVVEGNQLVFTNTPSVAARPVPGLEREGVAGPRPTTGRLPPMAERWDNLNEAN